MTDMFICGMCAGGLLTMCSCLLLIVLADRYGR